MLEREDLPLLAELGCTTEETVLLDAERALNQGIEEAIRLRAEHNLDLASWHIVERLLSRYVRRYALLRGIDPRLLAER